MNKQIQIETLKAALRVIYTWADFRGGTQLFPEDVKRLIKKVLEEINDENRR